MNPTDQLAAEARDEIRRYFNKPYYASDYGKDKVLAIIQSAIESYVTQPKEIPLTDGKFATVDHQDFISLAGLTWHCTSHGRAATGKTNYMHKVIASQMGIIGEVDHIDGNPLNNRRSNLRGCSRTQNEANKTKRDGLTSWYKGVHWSTSHEAWVAQIKQDGKVKYLGQFEVELDAALTYDAAALQQFGEFAKLNFPILKQIIEKAYRQGWIDREENLRVVKDAVSRATRASEQRPTPATASAVCECGHLDAEHRREKDHDECTVGECECDRFRNRRVGTAIVVRPKPDSASTGKDDLLPCPFCGSGNLSVEPLVGGFVVDCQDCGGGCGTCHDEQAARDEWNKRKSLREVLKEKGIDSDKVTANIEAMVATPSGGGREWHPLIPPSGGGEWTPQTVADIINSIPTKVGGANIHEAIAAAHNAALRDCGKKK